MKIALILNETIQAIYTEQSTPDYLSDPRFEVVTNAEVVGMIRDGEGWVSPPPPPQKVVSSFGRIITVLAYRLRFTQAERIGLKMAANAGTTQAAAVAVSVEDQLSAGYINLDHPATIAGTNALEAATLLGVGRAAAILSPPVYSAELLPQTRQEFGLPTIPTEAEIATNDGKGYTPEQYTVIINS